MGLSPISHKIDHDDISIENVILSRRKINAEFHLTIVYYEFFALTTMTFLDKNLDFIKTVLEPLNRSN